MTVVVGTVFDVLDVVLAHCMGLPAFEFSLAGSGVRVCADTPGLLRQVTEALLHRQSALTGSPDLTIFASEKQPPPELAMRPEWRVAERWQRREPVRAMSEQGMMCFDAISGETTFLAWRKAGRPHGLARPACYPSGSR